MIGRFPFPHVLFHQVSPLPTCIVSPSVSPHVREPHAVEVDRAAHRLRKGRRAVARRDRDRRRRRVSGGCAGCGGCGARRRQRRRRRGGGSGRAPQPGRRYHRPGRVAAATAATAAATTATTTTTTAAVPEPNGVAGLVRLRPEPRVGAPPRPPPEQLEHLRPGAL